MTATNTADDWSARAACAGKPTEFFFGHTGPDGRDERHNPVALAEGRRTCNACPVREECLNEALDGGGDVYGMWGGTTKTEREKLKRHIRRAKCPVCEGPHLHVARALQVCGHCGHSWTTMRPSQIRLNADAAA
jgi:WhiB family transcriptional regulator, redox-sensing transcriptional regulator